MPDDEDRPVPDKLDPEILDVLTDDPDPAVMAYIEEHGHPPWLDDPEPSAPTDLCDWLDNELKTDKGAAVSDAMLDVLRQARSDPAEWLRVRAVLGKHGVTRAVEAALRDTAEPIPVSDGDRPQIIVTSDERVIADRCIGILAQRGDLYQRGGMLCLVVETPPPPGKIERPKDTPRIILCPPSQVRSMLSDSIAWKKRANDQIVACHPPDWCVRDVHERGEWPGVRPVQYVTESPALRYDGSVLEAPGYDPISQIIYQPNATYPPIGDPSHDDAREAIFSLLEPVCDFPFRSNAHRAAWLAGVLTPFARDAFEGPAPLVLFDANVRGSGKSLLADVTGAIVTGRGMARMTQARDEDEERKKITSIALQGDRLVLIDNITRQLGSGALDAALTATVWAERILGRNECPRLPLVATWYATGNNVQIRGDTARRCLHVRLESPEEHPEDREGFKHPDLLGWVHAERPRLVAAALTVLRAYCLADRPAQGIRRWGTFQAWSDLVRSALTWAGCGDPGETRIELRDSMDQEAQHLPALISAILRLAETSSGSTVSAGQIFKCYQTSDSLWEDLREALDGLCPRTVNGKSIGKLLQRFRGRVCGGYMIDAMHGTRPLRWKVIDQTAQKRSEDDGRLF